LAPRELAPPLHSLPPILDNVPQTPTSSCSKGSRGLSVQPRVLGIFTETTVSPGPSKRQRPSRYAIRAGRNFASSPRFREAQTIPSPWRSCASTAAASYRRRPLGFIRRASWTISTNRSRSRCAPLCHQPADAGERLEVEPLTREERVQLEVRDHALEDVFEAPCLPLQRLIAPIGTDASAPEVGLYRVQHFGPVSVLTHREASPHLPSDPQRPARGDGNGEAAFSVDVSGDVGREELATATGAGV
jgi:hypothetical protein